MIPVYPSTGGKCTVTEVAIGLQDGIGVLIAHMEGYIATATVKVRSGSKGDGDLTAIESRLGDADTGSSENVVHQTVLVWGVMDADLARDFDTLEVILQDEIGYATNGVRTVNGRAELGMTGTSNHT